MKPGFFSFLVLGLAAFLAGCAGTEQRAGSREAPPGSPLGRLLAKTYSPSDLGIRLVTNSQTISWKESISPRTPVRLHLLTRDNLSRQPRIEGRLNDGKPVSFSIDTGAALNVIDARTGLAGHVRVGDPAIFKNRFEGLGGGEENYYAMIDDLRFGELNLRNVLTVVRAGEENQAERLDNALGMTSIAKFAWLSIDYGEGIAILAAEGEPPRRTREREAPFTLRSLQIWLDLKLGSDQVVSALLDTGNDSALMLPKSVVSQMGMLEAANRGEITRFMGIGGLVETHSFVIPLLTMGEQRFENVAAVMTPDNFPASIGSGIFEGLVLGIDIKSSKLRISDSGHE